MNIGVVLWRSLPSSNQKTQESMLCAKRFVNYAENIGFVSWLLKYKLFIIIKVFRSSDRPSCICFVLFPLLSFFLAHLCSRERLGWFLWNFQNQHILVCTLLDWYVPYWTFFILMTSFCFRDIDVLTIFRGSACPRIFS